jgi:hypothetical protein
MDGYSRVLSHMGKTDVASAVIHQHLKELNPSDIADQPMIAALYEAAVFPDSYGHGDPVTDARKAIEFAQLSIEADDPSFRRRLEYAGPLISNGKLFPAAAGVGRQLRALADLSTPPDERLHAFGTDVLINALHGMRENREAAELFAPRLTSFMSTPTGQIPYCNEWFADSVEFVATKEQSASAKSFFQKAMGSITPTAQTADSVIEALRWLARIQWQLKDPQAAVSTYAKADAVMKQFTVTPTNRAAILHDEVTVFTWLGKTEQAAELSKQMNAALAGN